MEKQIATSPRRGRKLEADKVWLLGLLSQAQTHRFYGKLVLTFEDGLARRSIKEEITPAPAED